MASRRRALGDHAVNRQPRGLQLTRLEDRLAPAISIMGPHSPTETDILRATGAVNWSAMGQLPNPAGLVSLHQVDQAWHFTLNHGGMQQHLVDVPFETAPGHHDEYFEMMIPRPDGTFQLFNVWEISMMEPGLAAQFPMIKTYRGQGVDDPYATLAADLTPAGFHAQVISPQGVFYLEPYYHQSTSVYIGYYKQHNVTPNAFYCTTSADAVELHEDEEDCGCGHGTSCGCPLCLAASGGDTTAPGGVGLFNTSNGATLRQYRLAVAATAEYTAFHGGTILLGQAAIVTAMNRVNQVYESQLSVRMNLIANNSVLVYTDAATDPYTNGNGSTMLGENQNNIDTLIGNANYDIGHVFSTGGGGVAGLGVVGITGQKARGVTGQTSPIGDSFWIDYVAHEMGHQFGGSHTFNGLAGNCGSNRSASNAYEQGSGTTIMAYAGICGVDNTQANSDAYFHWRSLDQISTLISSGAAVGFTQTATGNAIPNVDAGLNYTIPAQTPFALTGTATDADNDPLTYLWEEADLGPATNITTPDNGSSPLFRSFSPSVSPTRIFPRLQNLLANTNSPGEVLPSTNRTLNWRLTAFDNRTTGAFRFDSMAVTVVNTGAGFAVTAPNTAVNWSGLSAQTITWNVAGTTGNGINAATVDILLSTDGGLTFPTVVAAAVANDGSEIVTIPDLPTSQARIKVQPTNNIFFDFSDSNFTITAASPFQVVSSTPVNGGTVAAPMLQFDVVFTADVNAASIGTNDLTLTQGIVTNAELLNPNTVRYTLSGVPLDGPLTLSLANNAVTDNSANGNGQYIANITIDAGTIAFPTPLSANTPVGTLGHSGSVGGTIATTTDTDSFTLDLQAGQTISVSVTPSSTVRPTLSLTGPGGALGSQSATANGQPVLLQSLGVPSAGVYTVTVGNAIATVGPYALQVDLNTAQEAESLGNSANDTLVTAQNISSSGLSLGGGINRWAVRGRNDQAMVPLADELEPNNTTGTANDARFDFESQSSNLYHMNLTGTVGVGGDANDYFNIGALQVGDVITISQSGSLSARGTMLDPLVNLYRLSGGGAGQLMVQNNNGGVFNGTNGDALIYRYTVTVADTYYINAQRSGTTTSGTYQLGLWLENASTAPNTGGALMGEGTAANGSIASAENASSSWRAAQYLSTINGSITVGDADYYRFDFTAGDVVTFNMVSTSPLNARINLRNAGSTILALENGTSTGPDTASPIYGYRIATTGTYFLECLSASGTGTYSINTYLSSTTPPPPAVIGDDYYQITLPTNANIAVALDSQAAGTLNLDLLNDVGAVVATGIGGATNFDRGLQYVTPAVGNYYFRVNGTGNVPYYLAVVSGATIDAEPNDSFATAQTVFNKVVGGITGTDDWFIFPAMAGQLITLATSTPLDTPGEPNNTLDPRLDLYDPAGNLIASDDNSAVDGRNALLIQSASMTGDYRAKLSGANNTTGEYTLAVTYSNDPPPTVAAFVIDDGSSQRSVVRSLTVTFSEVVTLPTPNAGAFQLTRTGPGGSIGNVDVAVDLTGSTPTQTVARLTLAGPLTEFGSLLDGLYSFTILGSQIVDGSSQLLDGDGNGTPGGDFVNNLHRLFGDSNGDRSVTAADFNDLRLVYGSGPSIFDFDANGATVASDFNAFRLRYGMTI